MTINDAKAQVDELEAEAAAIDQQYVGVEEQVKKIQDQLEQKKADVAAQTVKVAKMRQQVGQVALAQFQNRTLNTTARLLLTSDTDGFLNQVSTVEKVSENQNSALQDFQSEQAELASLQRSTATDLEELQAQQKSLTDLRKKSDDKVAQAKAVLAKLTEEERKRIAAEEARQEAAARRAAEQAAAAAARSSSTRSSTSRSSSSSGSAKSSRAKSSSGSSSTVAGSGRAARAVAFAKSQLGKPYRFAAAGPSAYDCSGLTSAAWRAAGVSLPRTSQAQFGVGRSVSRSALRPGDLVFFYSGISHVAIYVGNGTVIHSPRPGSTVSYAKVSSMPYAGARRVG